MSPAVLANANKKKHPKAVRHTSKETMHTPTITTTITGTKSTTSKSTNTEPTSQPQPRQQRVATPDLLPLRVSSRKIWSEHV